MKNLSRAHCVPCEGGIPALGRAEALVLLRQLKGWKLSKGKPLQIEQEYGMKNFMAAVDLIRRIAQVAEKEGHHPDIHLTRYRRLAIRLYTHAIEGLSENDFILAAKIDQLPKKLKKK